MTTCVAAFTFAFTPVTEPHTSDNKLETFYKLIYNPGTGGNKKLSRRKSSKLVIKRNSFMLKCTSLN